MIARPILMSAPMVRALLREIHTPGTGKTQTRRAIKKAPTASGVYLLSYNHGIPEFNFGPDDRKPNGDLRWHRCPYGEIGDLLWVRESHYIIGEYDGPWPGSRWTHYAADQSNNLGDTDHQWTRGWKPSIHMPRSSSRLTLRITDVRVERLQDISEADARAEGVTPLFGGMPSHADEDRPTHYAAYARLWDSINGPGSWDANPWGWAISFRPELRNVDAVLKEAA